jgi:hypothetical protein
MQILMSKPLGSKAFVSVVQELGGPKLDTDTFEDIVAKSTKSFGTHGRQQSRRREVIFTKLRKSDSPAERRDRLAEGHSRRSDHPQQCLSMCDVNVHEWTGREGRPSPRLDGSLRRLL